MIGENTDKLSDSEGENLEGEIKYTELVQALKLMKNEKKAQDKMDLLQNIFNFSGLI